MHPALLVAFALSAPTAESTAGAPSEPAPTAGAPAEATPPQEAPSSLPPSTAVPAPKPEPAPAVAPAGKPSERTPAIGKTDTTVANAKIGDEVEVSKSKYKIGKGFSVATKDGRFSLQIRGRVQVRYDVEHPDLPDEETQQSVQIRRARLQFQGNVFSPHVKYYIQLGMSPADMTSGLPDVEGSIRRNPLRDARLEFDRLRDFTVWVGQFKVPFSRQRMNSSAHLNMVDRTSINAEFTLDRDIGVQAMSKDIGGLGHRLAYYAGVFMGEGRNAFALNDPGMLYVGRVEVLPFGKFDDFTEGDVGRSEKPGLSIAGAYAFQDRAHAARGVIGDPPADGGTTNFHHVNAEIFFKWRGVSLASALHWRKGVARRSGGAVDDMGMPIPLAAARSGLGWYAQLGWVVPKIPLEVVGRYGLIRNTFGAASSLRDSDEAGGGINYFFVGHDLKLQLDYFRLWDQTMGATTAERAANGVDRVRLQLQVYF
jgi:phosphate-selective porin OprO/OprP